MTMICMQVTKTLAYPVMCPFSLFVARNHDPPTLQTNGGQTDRHNARDITVTMHIVHYALFGYRCRQNLRGQAEASMHASSNHFTECSIIKNSSHNILLQSKRCLYK